VRQLLHARLGRALGLHCRHCLVLGLGQPALVGLTLSL
jgi:hypothetical protein